MLTYILLYIKIILKVDALDCFQQTPLYLSAINNPNHAMTKLLLSEGADPNFEIENHLPILSMVVLHSVKEKHVKIISYLLKYGAVISGTDRYRGETALHKAAFTGNTTLISHLMNNGADLYIKNIFGQTPLDIAKKYRNKEAEELLKTYIENDEEEQYVKVFGKHSY